MPEGVEPLVLYDEGTPPWRRGAAQSRTRPGDPALPTISDGDVGRWHGIDPPEIHFAIAGLVPLGMVTLLVGNGGVGKSTLMQMAGSCVAAHTSFLGKFTMTGTAAGVFAEDPDAVLHNRQFRINQHLHIDCSGIAGRFFPQSFAGRDALLWRDGGPAPFFGDLERQLAAIPDLRLVLLDNAAYLYGGAENDRAEVTAFLSQLNGMASRLGAGIMLSTHGSKSQDDTALRAASGSTAWLNASRSVLHLKNAKEDPAATLTVIKANHAETGVAVALEWNDELSLLVPAAAIGSIEARVRTRALDALIFETVRAGWDRGQPYSAAPQATGRYLPGFIARISRDRDHVFRTDEAKQVMLRWCDSGHLVEEKPKGQKRVGLRVARDPGPLTPDSSNS